jgi:pimeloyl-ACP methyl ester carboxylesterase
MATFNFNNHHIYFETYGSGKPLILLNGIMMSTRSWISFIETFSERNQLILFDMLDQGQSSKLEGQTYTQALQVEVLKSLIEHLKLDKVSLAGISYGGEVALQFAVKYPNLLDRVVLLNTTAFTSPQLTDVGRAWNKAALTGDGQAYYYTTIPVIYSPAYYERKLEWMRKREEILTPIFADKNFTSAMIRLTISAESHDVRDKLALINAPTLIVSSDQDFLTPIADQKYLASHIKDAGHVVIQNTGHASMYEQPHVFVTLILGFVNAKSLNFII